MAKPTLEEQIAFIKQLDLPADIKKKNIANVTAKFSAGGSLATKPINLKRSAKAVTREALEAAKGPGKDIDMTKVFQGEKYWNEVRRMLSRERLGNAKMQLLLNESSRIYSAPLLYRALIQSATSEAGQIKAAKMFAKYYMANAGELQVVDNSGEKPEFISASKNMMLNMNMSENDVSTIMLDVGRLAGADTGQMFGLTKRITSSGTEGALEAGAVGSIRYFNTFSDMLTDSLGGRPSYNPTTDKLETSFFGIKTSGEGASRTGKGVSLAKLYGAGAFGAFINSLSVTKKRLVIKMMDELIPNAAKVAKESGEEAAKKLLIKQSGKGIKYGVAKELSDKVAKQLSKMTIESINTMVKSSSKIGFKKTVGLFGKSLGAPVKGIGKLATSGVTGALLTGFTAVASVMDIIEGGEEANVRMFFNTINESGTYQERQVDQNINELGIEGADITVTSEALRKAGFLISKQSALTSGTALGYKGESLKIANELIKDETNVMNSEISKSVSNATNADFISDLKGQASITDQVIEQQEINVERNKPLLTAKYNELEALAIKNNIDPRNIQVTPEMLSMPEAEFEASMEQLDKSFTSELWGTKLKGQGVSSSIIAKAKSMFMKSELSEDSLNSLFVKARGGLAGDDVMNVELENMMIENESRKRERERKLNIKRFMMSGEGDNSYLKLLPEGDQQLYSALKKRTDKARHQLQNFEKVMGNDGKFQMINKLTRKPVSSQVLSELTMTADYTIPGINNEDERLIDFLDVFKSNREKVDNIRNAIAAKHQTNASIGAERAYHLAEEKRTKDNSKWMMEAKLVNQRIRRAKQQGLDSRLVYDDVLKNMSTRQGSAYSEGFAETYKGVYDVPVRLNQKPLKLNKNP